MGEAEPELAAVAATARAVTSAKAETAATPDPAGRAAAATTAVDIGVVYVMQQLVSMSKQ